MTDRGKLYEELGRLREGTTTVLPAGLVTPLIAPNGPTGLRVNIGPERSPVVYLLPESIVSAQRRRRAVLAALSANYGGSLPDHWSIIIAAYYVGASRIYYRTGSSAIVPVVDLKAENQVGRTLGHLANRPTCGPEFIADYLPNFRARISDLRKFGYEIKKEVCPHRRHKTTQYRYFLPAVR